MSHTESPFLSLRSTLSVATLICGFLAALSVVRLVIDRWTPSRSSSELAELDRVTRRLQIDLAEFRPQGAVRAADPQTTPAGSIPTATPAHRPQQRLTGIQSEFTPSHARRAAPIANTPAVAPVLTPTATNPSAASRQPAVALHPLPTPSATAPAQHGPVVYAPVTVTVDNGPLLSEISSLRSAVEDLATSIPSPVDTAAVADASTSSRTHSGTAVSESASREREQFIRTERIKAPHDAFPQTAPATKSVEVTDTTGTTTDTATSRAAETATRPEIAHVASAPHITPAAISSENAHAAHQPDPIPFHVQPQPQIVALEPDSMPQAIEQPTVRSAETMPDISASASAVRSDLAEQEFEVQAESISTVIDSPPVLQPAPVPEALEPTVADFAFEALPSTTVEAVSIERLQPQPLFAQSTASISADGAEKPVIATPWESPELVALDLTINIPSSPGGLPASVNVDAHRNFPDPFADVSPGSAGRSTSDEPRTASSRRGLIQQVVHWSEEQSGRVASSLAPRSKKAPASEPDRNARSQNQTAVRNAIHASGKSGYAAQRRTRPAATPPAAHSLSPQHPKGGKQSKRHVPDTAPASGIDGLMHRMSSTLRFAIGSPSLP